jgi:hypothetical protein
MGKPEGWEAHSDMKMVIGLNGMFEAKSGQEMATLVLHSNPLQLVAISNLPWKVIWDVNGKERKKWRKEEWETKKHTLH